MYCDLESIYFLILLVRSGICYVNYFTQHILVTLSDIIKIGMSLGITHRDKFVSQTIILLSTLIQR